MAFGYKVKKITALITAGTLSGLESVIAKAKEMNLAESYGLYPGKETVQIYVEKPQGNIGNPALELADFEKTSSLLPSGEEVLSFSVPFYRIASYDDRPESPQSFSYVLLQGDYVFRAGNSIRNLKPCGKFSVSGTKVLKSCKQLLAPEIPCYQKKCSRLARCGGCKHVYKRRSFGAAESLLSGF